MLDELFLESAGSLSLNRRLQVHELPVLRPNINPDITSALSAVLLLHYHLFCPLLPSHIYHSRSVYCLIEMLSMGVWLRIIQGYGSLENQTLQSVTITKLIQNELYFQ